MQGIHYKCCIHDYRHFWSLVKSLYVLTEEQYIQFYLIHIMLHQSLQSVEGNLMWLCKWSAGSRKRKWTLFSATQYSSTQNSYDISSIQVVRRLAMSMVRDRPLWETAELSSGATKEKGPRENCWVVSETSREDPHNAHVPVPLLHRRALQKM